MRCGALDQAKGADDGGAVESDESPFVRVVAELLVEERDHGVVIGVGRRAYLQREQRPSDGRAGVESRTTMRRSADFEGRAEAVHPGERHGAGILADDQDAVAPEAARGGAHAGRAARSPPRDVATTGATIPQTSASSPAVSPA